MATTLGNPALTPGPAPSAPAVAPAKPLKVVKVPPVRYIVKEAFEQVPGVRTLRVSPEAGGPVPAFQPGMFVDLHLAKPDGSWTGYFAAYSIASSPTTTEYYELTYKLKGPFTQELAKLKAGDLIGCTAPQGKGYYVEGEDLVLIAGGIGVTPSMGMLRYATATGSKNKITLLYSSHNPQEVTYGKEMDELAAKNPNIRIVHTFTRCTPEQIPKGCEAGRINEEMLRRYVTEPADKHWFLCGSVEMTRALLTVLRVNLGVNFKNIHFESWG